jgi:hypothetical protein
MLLKDLTLLTRTLERYPSIAMSCRETDRSIHCE